ncbi:MAG: sugar phosphate nucleotidyltransferase [Armatimonadota bacterium]
MNVQRGELVAVLPVAGLGSRLRPLTDVCAKELLPVGRKPAFDWIVEEIRAAGIETAVLVVSPEKVDVFRRRYGAGSNGMTFDYVVQPEMRGLGDALACAENLLEGRDLLLALGDAIFEESEPGAVARRVLDADGEIVIAVQEVLREQTGRYGIVRPKTSALQDPFAIDGVVEKPDPSAAPGRHAVCARYRLPNSIFDALRACPMRHGEELPVTGAIDDLLRSGIAGCAVPLHPEERRHDIGGFDTYFRAFLTFALDDDTYGAALRTSFGDALS